MDWKKLHTNITHFADKHQIPSEESDLSYGNGTLTTYQLNEDATLFYEFKHAKPITEKSSKLRIYSKATGELSINVKTRFIGKPSIKSTFEPTETFRELLSGLAKKIGSFQ
ncbi:MAG: hypothetical protein AAF551_07520, partial [Bacteroidota bacterium]